MDLSGDGGWTHHLTIDSYIFWVFGCMLAGCWIFGRIRSRWPAMSLARFLVVGALCCIALDTILDHVESRMLPRGESPAGA